MIQKHLFEDQQHQHFLKITPEIRSLILPYIVKVALSTTMLDVGEDGKRLVRVTYT